MISQKKGNFRTAKAMVIMMYLPEKGYKRIFVIVFYIIIVFTFFYFIFRNLIGCILPFVIGWFIAMCVQRPIKFLKAKFKIPKKLSAFVLVMLIVSTVLFIFAMAIFGIISEVDSLSKYLADNADNISNSIESFFSNLTHRLDFLSNIFKTADMAEKIKSETLNYTTNILSSLISKLPAFAAGIATFMPKILIFSVILIISAFYFSFDFHNINAFIIGQFGDKTKKFVKEFKNIFINVIGKLIKAYLLIAFITFTELYLGFTLIGIDYALTIALITCAIDILPILGSGFILLPWCVFLFLNGNFSLGISLLVMYIAISITRQFIEPKVIGSFIDLHPLVSLMSLFVGLSVMGLPGMFLFPIIVIILKTMNDNGSIKLYKG